MRISDWSSDVCSSDLVDGGRRVGLGGGVGDVVGADDEGHVGIGEAAVDVFQLENIVIGHVGLGQQNVHVPRHAAGHGVDGVGDRHALFFQAFGHLFQRMRSEEHTSELQSLMRISYAVFCLKKKK